MPETNAVRVLYASETGTAEDLALGLRDTLSALSVPVLSCGSVDAYDIARLPGEDALLIFVVATCGDGAHPRHLTPLWAVLRQATLPAGMLSAVRFAVLGLGDRAYPRFNAAARRLFARLAQLGAVPVLALADSLADESDADGQDAVVVPWVRALAARLRPGEDVDAATAAAAPPAPPPVHLDVRPAQKDKGKEIESEKENGKVKAEDEGKWQAGQAAASEAELPIITATRITAASVAPERDVRHVSLSTAHLPPSSALRTHAPGDVLHVLPRNRPSAVDAFFSLFPLIDPHATVVSTSAPLNVRTPCSVRNIVAAHLDLSAPPRRRFLGLLAAHARAPAEAAKLTELASLQGADALAQYAFREQRSVLMALRDFPSARPDLPHLLAIAPRIRARAFSVAGGDPSANRIDICAAVVRYTTPLRFARIGLCTGFLAATAPGDVVPASLTRASALRFDASAPAVLVATGTGIAPLRAFLSAVERQQEARTTFTAVDRVLVFGCRSEDTDFLYAEDIKRWASPDVRVLSHVATAFSRDGPEKVYVQHRLRECANHVWRVIEPTANGRVYVAGAAGSMPKAVRQALVEVCDELGPAEHPGPWPGGERYVRTMEMNGRLQVECW